MEQVCRDITVMRNDEISVDEVQAFSHILISPGPGLPAEAGITMAVIKKYHESKSLLGVCLGCQAIAEFFGGNLYNQKLVAHGIARKVNQVASGKLLQDMPPTFEAGLYHSWAIDESNLTKEVLITSKSEMNTVMSLEHLRLNIYGVQFHPESIMTKNGLQIIKNWLKV